MHPSIRSIVAAVPVAAALVFAHTGASFVPGAVLRAQSPESGALDAVIRTSDSLLAAGSPAEALGLLEPLVPRTKPQNARLWHRYGLAAWAVARPQRSGGFIRDNRIIKLLEGADSALHLASELAPDSARFALDLARFLLNSEMGPTRGAAARFTDRALEAARRTGDDAMLAQAAVEHGRVYWRRYESTGRRALSRTGLPLQLGFATQEGWTRDKAKDFIEQAVIEINQDPDGTSDFKRARELFNEAVRADPNDPVARRNQYMAVAELEQWPQLRELAAARVAESPFDATSWFALGLAHQRLGRSDSASIAFDSALVRITGEERARLTSLARILRPRAQKNAGAIADTAALGKLSPAQRQAYGQLYWLMADPLAITRENEYEAEFLARVTYAELRFTDEEAGIRGADTDRGDIHIRYGPPDKVLNTIGGSTTNAGASTAGNVIIWIYATGNVFTFDLAAGFGRARIAFDDRRNVEEIINNAPVSFANVDATRAVDTIPVRYARFRAGGDSLDVLAAARVPFARLVRDVEIDRARVQVGFRVIDQFAQPRADTLREQLVSTDAASARDERYSVRIGAGFNLLRVEAFQPESRNAARALLRLEPTATSGFGVSDVLLSRGAEPKDGVPLPRRWNDLAIDPSLGVFRPDQPIGLVWETYELARDGEGSNAYRVSLVIEKRERGGVLGLAARVLDNAGQALGRASRSGNGVTVSFDRKLPAAATQLEYYAINLSGATPGTYDLVITVEDTVGRRSATTRTAFTIAP